MALANTRQAREVEPYLARFEDDWATGQILRQYINGRRKYENAKANGKVKVGEKRKKTATKQLPSHSDDEVELAAPNSDGNSNGEGSEGEDEWHGLVYLN